MSYLKKMGQSFKTSLIRKREDKDWEKLIKEEAVNQSQSERMLRLSIRERSRERKAQFHGFPSCMLIKTACSGIV